MKDFRKFLNFYMKDVRNDWPSTPKVRVSFLRFNKPPIDNIPFTDYPIPKTQYVKFYLSGDKTLKIEEDAGRIAYGSVSYRSDALSLQMDSDEMNEALFSYTFPSASRLMGPARATIYLSCDSSDDMDVFTSIRKADSTGRTLRNLNIPVEDLGVESAEEVQLTNPFFYLGPSGILRASHRTVAEIDRKRKKTSQMIRHDHSKQVKISPGQVVKLEMSLWPAAIQWEVGEKLLFKVGGHPMTLAELEVLRGQFKGDNAGDHVLHFGGEYASFVEVPFVAL